VSTGAARRVRVPVRRDGAFTPLACRSVTGDASEVEGVTGIAAAGDGLAGAGATVGSIAGCIVGQVRGSPPTAARSAPHSAQAYRPGAAGTPHSGQTTVFVAIREPR
jgi:hypothetical protein